MGKKRHPDGMGVCIRCGLLQESDLTATDRVLTEVEDSVAAGLFSPALRVQQLCHVEQAIRGWPTHSLPCVAQD